MQGQEVAKWKCTTRILKYDEDINPFTKEGKEAEFHKLYKPYEVKVIEDNCLLNTGIDIMWDLVTGVSTASFGTSSTIGVGDSTASATASQTDLQAASNKDYHVMESGYPTSTAQAATFKSSFGAGHAEYAWNEWVVKQTTCLNRKVESLGTKASGTWTLECSISLS